MWNMASTWVFNQGNSSLLFYYHYIWGYRRAGWLSEVIITTPTPFSHQLVSCRALYWGRSCSVLMVWVLCEKWYISVCWWHSYLWSWKTPETNKSNKQILCCRSHLGLTIPSATKHDKNWFLKKTQHKHETEYIYLWREITSCLWTHTLASKPTQSQW